MVLRVWVAKGSDTRAAHPHMVSLAYLDERLAQSNRDKLYSFHSVNGKNEPESGRNRPFMARARIPDVFWMNRSSHSDRNRKAFSKQKRGESRNRMTKEGDGCGSKERQTAESHEKNMEP